VYVGRILAACFVIVFVLFAAWWVAWKLVLGKITFFQEIFGALKPPARNVKPRRGQLAPRKASDPQIRMRSRQPSSTPAWHTEQLGVSPKPPLTTEKAVVNTASSDISPPSEKKPPLPPTERTIPVYDDYFARKDSPERSSKRTFVPRGVGS